MASSMDIRLNYGTWPADEGESTDSDNATSGNDSPHLYQSAHQDELQQGHVPALQRASALARSDLFSDAGENVPDQDFLDAESNMAISSFENTSQAFSYPLNAPPSIEATNPVTTGQAQSHDSPVIDLTDSPPQPLTRPTTSTTITSTTTTTTTTTDRWRIPEQSTMPPISRNRNEATRPAAAASSSSSSQTEGRPSKRRRLFCELPNEPTPSTEPKPPNTNASGDDIENPQEIEAVDLTDINNESDLSKAISKQQQDAIQAQTKQSHGHSPPGRTSLTSYKCPICMDTPEDATSTICGKPAIPSPSPNLTPTNPHSPPFLPGHLFCHTCILSTLHFSQQQHRDHHQHQAHHQHPDRPPTPYSQKTKGTCPVCRKPLARKDEPGPGRTLVPLDLKLTTARQLKGKARQGGGGGGGGSEMEQGARNTTKPGGGGGGGGGSSDEQAERRQDRDTTEAIMWRDLTTLEGTGAAWRD
jgi:hypothetical protein